MRKISVEDMLSGKKSRYALVIGVAKRAREIAKGYAQSDTIINKKPVLMAIEELKAHRFNIIEDDD